MCSTGFVIRSNFVVDFKSTFYYFRIANPKEHRNIEKQKKPDGLPGFFYTYINDSSRSYGLWKVSLDYYLLLSGYSGISGKPL